MTYYSCFDQKGQIIARCQTFQDIEVLKKMGRPIVEVKEMKNEESVVCSLTGSPSDFIMDYYKFFLLKQTINNERFIKVENTRILFFVFFITSF